jgi:site-specific DNA-cytosine methylase
VGEAEKLRSTLGERAASLRLAAKSALNVVSIFNGIGCPLEALRGIKAPIGTVHAQDWDDVSGRIFKARFPEARFDTLPPDARDITEEHIKRLGDIDVFIATAPCQDFSRAKLRDGGERLGLAGPQGSLLLVLMRVWEWVMAHNPGCQYFIENVDFSDMKADWETVCKVLGQPVFLNSADHSYTWRRRAFWTGTYLPPGWERPVGPKLSPDAVLDEGRTLVGGSCPTLTASWYEGTHHEAPGGHDVWEWTRKPIKVWDKARGCECFVRPEEAERLMGLPTGYTAITGVSAVERLRAVGNGVDVRVAMHVMRHFRWAEVHKEEAGVREAQDGVWGPPIEEAVHRDLTLKVGNMVQWLSPGPCPAGVPGVGWDAEMTHPKVEEDIVDWAHGSTLRYEGDRNVGTAVPNCATCYVAPEEMRKCIRGDVDKGWIAGPFPFPPLKGFHQIARALIDEMEKSGKYRPISVNNLPKGDSVNDSIPKAPDPITLPTHKRIRRKIRQQHGLTGRVVLAKRDLKSAYRNVAVRPSDWHLCGMKWDGQFFVDTRLSFGCRSSVDKFLSVSDALEWALRRWGVNVVHYIDDFIFISGSDEEAAEAIRKFDILCEAWGIPVKKQKDEGPGPVVECLGVVYDMDRMVAVMPARQLDAVYDGCASVLAGGTTVGQATSLVGVLTWVSDCMDQAAPFVAALRSAADKARAAGQAEIQTSRRVLADMKWWMTAVECGMAAEGVAILPTVVRKVHAGWKGDAGSEWGMGAHDASHFYRAKHPEHVRRAAMRAKTTSSKYLELFQLLVLARLRSETWAGTHVEMQVDNLAMESLLRKMYTSRQEENDILREIALLQAVHGWSWDVIWRPREENDAADALSKNDLRRFHNTMPECLVEMAVSAEDVAPPRLEVRGRRRAIVGAGLGPQDIRELQRPTRAVLGPVYDGKSGLREHLRTGLNQVMRLTKVPGAEAGVTSYLKYADRMQMSREEMLPDNTDVGVRKMEDNMLLYMMDAVQEYPQWIGGVRLVKKKVSPASMKTYMTHINSWLTDEWGANHHINLRPKVKALKVLLTSALPSAGGHQKDGVSVTVLEDILKAVVEGGDPYMWEAMFSLAWVGVLRPGEFTVPTVGGLDVTRHLMRESVRFYDHEVEVFPGGTGKPTHMVVVIKHSKTDQLRLTKDVVIGATGGDVCALSAMWRYLRCCPKGVTSALFTTGRGPVTYAQMRTKLQEALMTAGVTDTSRYGGHSFRIGGSQALAAAGKSITYIMSYGRWSCIDSVLRYVKTPEFVRIMDAGHMVAARTGWHVGPMQAALNANWDVQSRADKLWTARDMMRAAPQTR